MAMQDEVDTPRLLVIGVVGTIVITLIVLAAQILYFEVSRNLERERNIEPVNRQLGQYLAEQNEKLHGYGWVNQSAGTVSIPIERAMELTLRDLEGAGRGHSD
jgi:hypothetical protein